MDEAAVADAEKKAIQEIKNAIVAHPDDVAAIIIEPIQGEGGDNHFRNDFFPFINFFNAQVNVPTIWKLFCRRVTCYDNENKFVGKSK